VSSASSSPVVTPAIIAVVTTVVTVIVAASVVIVASHIIGIVAVSSASSRRCHGHRRGRPAIVAAGRPAAVVPVAVVRVVTIFGGVVCGAFPSFSCEELAVGPTAAGLLGRTAGRRAAAVVPRITRTAMVSAVSFALVSRMVRCLLRCGA
jgi:hypothetical protein